ncbi:MAG: hypothetical protein IPP81_19905 [Chitinophagaceae bacterium]|nr:hypothetical protein [Chitinophagaceae bacterium]
MKNFTKSYKKKCLVCPKEFTSVRIDAKTCSDICRSRLSQARLNGAKTSKEVGNIQVVMSNPVIIIPLIANSQKKITSLIARALPEKDWNDTISRQVTDLMQARIKHGKDSYQYKNILQFMTEWSVPRITGDGSIYLGPTKMN